MIDFAALQLACIFSITQSHNTVGALSYLTKAMGDVDNCDALLGQVTYDLQESFSFREGET